MSTEDAQLASQIQRLIARGRAARDAGEPTDDILRELETLQQRRLELSEQGQRPGAQRRAETTFGTDPADLALNRALENVQNVLIEFTASWNAVTKRLSSSYDRAERLYKEGSLYTPDSVTVLQTAFDTVKQTLLDCDDVFGDNFIITDMERPRDCIKRLERDADAFDAAVDGLEPVEATRTRRRAVIAPTTEGTLVRVHDSVGPARATTNVVSRQLDAASRMVELVNHPPDGAQLKILPIRDPTAAAAIYNDPNAQKVDAETMAVLLGNGKLAVEIIDARNRGAWKLRLFTLLGIGAATAVGAAGIGIGFGVYEVGAGVGGGAFEAGRGVGSMATDIGRGVRTLGEGGAAATETVATGYAVTAGLGTLWTIAAPYLPVVFRAMIGMQKMQVQATRRSVP